MTKKQANITPVDQEMEKVTSKKSLNRKAFHYIEKYLPETSAKYFAECNTFLTLLTDGEKSVKKAHKANNCNNRFCPVCSWKKAKKDAMKIGVMMAAVEQIEKKDFLFLTLTAPNCTGEELVDTINQFNKAFHKLFKRRNVNKAVKGYVRKLEVTTDQESIITKELYRRKKEYFDKRNLKVGDENPQHNTYNPHFHVILVVDKGYFKKAELYIKHEEWLQMWKDCMEDQSITQVRIEKLKQKGNSNAVAEIAKYTAKNDDLLHSQGVFDTFYKALKGRQLLTFHGIMKEYAKKYEEGELDEFKEQDKNIYTHLLIATWANTKYIQELRKLTEQELEKYNQKSYVEESEDVD